MDWASIFIQDTTWAFASEILLRCMLMYIMIILFLRLTGKRGVRQLSIFEVAIILSLGSIAFNGNGIFDIQNAADLTADDGAVIHQHTAFFVDINAQH